MSDIDLAVIGAGVVGLSVAAACARRGREVVVIEGAMAIGTATSSRNSEVIHAGLYYAPGSLKARLCVEGNQRLYAWCADRAVDCRQSGKLVVACSDAEVAILGKLADIAVANRVKFDRLGADEVHRLEPALACRSGFWVESSGQVDSHGLMLSLVAEIERFGGMVAFGSPVVGGRLGEEMIVSTGGREPASLSCHTLVNCAGLAADRVSAALGLPAHLLPRLHYAKGSYFFVSGKPPFDRLVYPVPTPESAGLHYAVDWSGRGRFGPDLEWVSGIDYRVDEGRGALFTSLIRRFWPGLPDRALQPDFAGIRPKLQGPDDPPRDFMVQTAEGHGVQNYIALYGIDSPGLTSCLALGELVADLIFQKRGSLS